MSILPQKYRHIAVEGPIGAGKTTLARLLAQRSGGTALLEEPAANPFLRGFYQDRARYALSAQLFFLLQRFQQLRTLEQTDLFKRVTISDFILDKDPLFARLTLDDDEWRLYEQVYDRLKSTAAPPDLVIYLQASPRTLIERVRQRGISYERAIEEEYLLRVAEGYAQLFFRYDAAPVLTINSEHLNFAAAQDFELLLERIRDMRGTREFFNREG